MLYIIFILCPDSFSSEVKTEPPIECLFIGSDPQMFRGAVESAVHRVVNTDKIFVTCQYDHVVSEMIIDCFMDGGYASQNN